MKINGEQESFNRLNDVFFKYVLASPERKHITIAFLNAVLSHLRIDGEEPIIIEDIEFLDREAVQESENAKGMRFDVLARSVDGRRFHIEVQNAREDYFLKRSFFYAASEYVTQLERGMSYDNLEPVIFIGIMNFTLIGSRDKPENWYSLHRFMNVESHKSNFRNIELHMIELPLLRAYLGHQNPKPNDMLEEILCYFGSIGDEKFMEELAERNSVIEDLQAFERLFRNHPALIRDYMINALHEADVKLTLRNVRREGREEGREEGLQEARKETARSLRSQGILTDEQIAQAMNMPIEAVEAL